MLQWFSKIHVIASISEVKFYQNIMLGLFLAIILLFIAVFIQRRVIKRLRRELDEARGGAAAPAPETESAPPAQQTSPRPQAKAAPKNLPDPGLLYKFSLAGDDISEKFVTIGQTEGTIKTFSTEIINDHLSLYIRILDNRRDKDIYDMPDHIKEEYQIDLRRDGKVLYYMPGMKNYEPMGSRMRLMIKQKPDEMGDPTFKTLNPKQPVRFRVGDRLNSEGKFINGFFEFHLFTKDYQVKTKAGIPKTEKYFLIRLYKIYPGYDTGATTSDGLYPMIDPFTTG